MPIINITVSGTADAALSAQIAETVSALTKQHLRKDPKVTAVAISYIDPQHWFVGGPSLQSQAKRSFWLDIKVVDGTNTKQELEAYLAVIYKAMQGLLGDLHEESYVLVHEVPAAAYGFTGKTQEFRFIAGKMTAQTLT
jgi:4-oxalocrotonate tautomerase